MRSTGKIRHNENTQVGTSVPTEKLMKNRPLLSLGTETHKHMLPAAFNAQRTCSCSTDDGQVFKTFYGCSLALLNWK